MTFRITSSYFCAGGELIDMKVTRCAPILKYMKGWTFGRVQKYCGKKGWKVEVTE